MASRALIGMAVAAALIAACDVSQKMPQTTVPAATQSAGGAVPGGTVAIGREGQEARVPAAPAMSAAPGEKSIRLQGPGVSRARQTRV